MSKEVMKNTPGPWTFYDDSNDGKTNRIEIVAIGKTVARIYHSVPAEDLPNARLIAAAPDLLDALKAATAALEWRWESIANRAAPVHETAIQEAYNQARAAIATATGDKA